MIFESPSKYWPKAWHKLCEEYGLLPGMDVRQNIDKVNALRASLGLPDIESTDKLGEAIGEIESHLP